MGQSPSYLTRLEWERAFRKQRNFLNITQYTSKGIPVSNNPKQSVNQFALFLNFILEVHCSLICSFFFEVGVRFCSLTLLAQFSYCNFIAFLKPCSVLFKMQHGRVVQEEKCSSYFFSPHSLQCMIIQLYLLLLCRVLIHCYQVLILLFALFIIRSFSSCVTHVCVWCSEQRGRQENGEKEEGE